MLKGRDDYEAALTAAEDIFAATRGTPEGEKLEQIISLIENYEAVHFPLTALQPVAADKCEVIMREKFEEYAREFGFSLELWPNEDNFLEHDTNMIYAAWCEAWQTATQQNAAPRQKEYSNE